jgi:hypothetical protein
MRVALPRAAQLHAIDRVTPSLPVDAQSPSSDQVLPGQEAPDLPGTSPAQGEVAPLPPVGGERLTADQDRLLTELQQIDRNVRSHESAHQAAGAGLAGGASYSFQVGPDGKQYAVGGEVPIDMSPESDPAATIAKMRRVRAAALAPMDPSAQDLAVASAATQMEAQAQEQLRAQQRTPRDASSDQPQPWEKKKPTPAALRAARAYGANAASLQAPDSVGQHA